MKETITITDITRMIWNQRVCVAGYNEKMECIRPIIGSKNPHESWLNYGEDRKLSPFDKVEIEVINKIPDDPPNTEDWNIDGTHKSVKGALNETEQKEFLKKICDADVGSIFGATINTDYGYYLTCGSGSRSLGTVIPKSIEEVFFGINWRKLKTKITFYDQSDKKYRLTVTDLAFQNYMDNYKEKKTEISDKLLEYFQETPLYFRIGLARGWKDHPDKCYLQITGVYSYPSYTTIVI